MKRPKLSYYLRWHKDQLILKRIRTRGPIRLNDYLCVKGLPVGFVDAMGWEGDKFVLNLG